MPALGSPVSREAGRFSPNLLDSLGEGVFALDAEGYFTFINPVGLRLLGYDSEAELLGENAHALIHHPDADDEPYPEARCPIYRVMETGEPLQKWRDWFWRCDGSGFYVEVCANPLWREGRGRLPASTRRRSRLGSDLRRSRKPPIGGAKSNLAGIWSQLAGPALGGNSNPNSSGRHGPLPDPPRESRSPSIPIP